MHKKLHSLPSLDNRRKELRKNQTKEENIIWWHIKDKRLEAKFRRQHSIGGYIVDFYCSEKRLIVEIDGPIHNDFDSKEYDKIRDKFFTELDYKVLRFSNNEVNNDIFGVLTKIKSYL